MLAVTVSAALLIAMIGGGAEAFAAKRVTQASSLKALVKQTNALPQGAASNAKRRQLKLLVLHARKVAKKKPCGAVKDLAKYRRVLGKVKLKTGKRNRKATVRLTALGPASLQASRLLLADKRTKRCGGGVKPSKLKSTKTSVLSSDKNGMRLRVKLPGVRFAARSGGGKSWTQLVLPNTDAPGAPGTPGIPTAASTFGVPDGASVDVDPGKTTSYTLDGVDVYPVQPDTADANTNAPNFLKPPFAAAPFKLSSKAYDKKGLFPADAADGGIIGTSRDITIGGLNVPAVQYDPTKKKLKVLTSVDVKIDFKGGSHEFSNELGSPWEQPQRRLAGSLLNAGIVRPGGGIIYQPCGEEMLVITNPATLAAATQLSTARNAAGLLTRVVQTGAGAGQIGTTTAAIQTYIRGQLTRFGCIHPSYVTIIGDDELVPTFTATPGGIPSDLQYSMKNDTDELPDVAVGRIVGNDLAQVTAAVTKIINYETTAPTGSFLTKATVAAQFQDTDEAGEVNDGQEDRTFIQFAETVRNGLAARGVTVDRIYADNPSTNPLRFNDGTNLPASLQKPTFAWDGDGADVTAAWNEGRFLMIHRDHGWSDGWGDPFYTTTDVDALSNGSLLPVVMSINCASAAYDTDETSFVQNALVKADGGAVGVFGDTRNSPSWHNSQLGLGMVDALLPSVLPSEGPATKQRMGDALINGKLRLAGLSPPGSDGNTRNELYLWHYFGDPSMQMWGGGQAPIVFSPNLIKAIYKQKIGPPNPGDPPPYLVEITLPPGLAGQPISLLRNGEVIGKALAGDGVASIPATFGDGSVKPGELRVAFEGDGAQPVSAPVDGVTELTQSCPTGVDFNSQGPTDITVTGTLAGAPAGSPVDVTFFQSETLQGAPGRTVVLHPTTNGEGDWTATVSTTDRTDRGTWTVSSNYAGAAGLASSQAGPCSFPVADPTG
jgi:hypothetical protein